MIRPICKKNGQTEGAHKGNSFLSMGGPIGDILKTIFDFIRIVLIKRYIFRKVVRHPT